MSAVDIKLYGVEVAKEIEKIEGGTRKQNVMSVGFSTLSFFGLRYFLRFALGKFSSYYSDPTRSVAEKTKYLSYWAEILFSAWFFTLSSIRTITDKKQKKTNADGKLNVSEPIPAFPWFVLPFQTFTLLDLLECILMGSGSPAQIAHHIVTLTWMSCGFLPGYDIAPVVIPTLFCELSTVFQTAIPVFSKGGPQSKMIAEKLKPVVLVLFFVMRVVYLPILWTKLYKNKIQSFWFMAPGLWAVQAYWFFEMLQSYIKRTRAAARLMK